MLHSEKKTRLSLTHSKKSKSSNFHIRIESHHRGDAGAIPHQLNILVSANMPLNQPNSEREPSTHYKHCTWALMNKAVKSLLFIVCQTGTGYKFVLSQP